jgi:hypothetical protein
MLTQYIRQKTVLRIVLALVVIIIFLIVRVT